MENNRLLSIYFLLGKSPKDWDFMQDDWEDEYQESCNLTWAEFMTLQEQGWWKYHAQAIKSFTSSFSSTSSFARVQETFESIAADSEDWNDFIEFLMVSDDFEDAWDNSWLTRDEMEASLEEFIAANSDSNSKIIELKNSLKEWFNSNLRESFKNNILGLFTPLEKEIKNVTN